MVQGRSKFHKERLQDHVLFCFVLSFLTMMFILWLMWTTLYCFKSMFKCLSTSWLHSFTCIIGSRFWNTCMYEEVSVEGVGWCECLDGALTLVDDVTKKCCMNWHNIHIHTLGDWYIWSVILTNLSNGEGHNLPNWLPLHIWGLYIYGENIYV